MLEAGFGLKSILKSLCVSRATLWWRLENQGEWPSPDFMPSYRPDCALMKAV